MDLERQERDPREAEAVDPPPSPPPRVARAKEAKVKEARIIIMLDHPIAVTRTTMAQKEKLERTKTPPP